jgi:hypothetical protein
MRMGWSPRQHPKFGHCRRHCSRRLLFDLPCHAHSGKLLRESLVCATRRLRKGTRSLRYCVCPQESRKPHQLRAFVGDTFRDTFPVSTSFLNCILPTTLLTRPVIVHRCRERCVAIGGISTLSLLSRTSRRYGCVFDHLFKVVHECGSVEC